MNGYYLSTNFIGALGEYPIYDYINSIDSNSSNFTTTTSNILQNDIINTSNILQTQITNTCNLIYKDDNLNTIVRISAQNPYYPIGDPVEMRFTNVNGSYLTKITQTGELFVYHPTAPLPAGYAPGWWGVENKIANVITDTQGLRFDVTQLQAATGASAITNSATATAAVAGAGAGLASAGTATAVAGTAIAGGDIGSAALGVAGATLFAVLGYLSYQAQIASNLTSNGFLTQASQIQNNINSANILLTDNISNICVGKGFITSNIKTPQLIPYLTTNTLKLNNKVITTLALKDIDNFVQTQYGTYYDITNGSLAIGGTPTQMDFLVVGGKTTIQGELIVEGKIKENSLYLNNVYISSNILQNQNYINSNSITNVLIPYISSNILQIQNYINSNSITNVLTPYPNYNYLNSYSSNYISSNILQIQNYINSNSITNILTNYSSSNAVQNIIMNMTSVCKHTGFYITVSTAIGINSTTYYKYDIDLRKYVSLGVLQIGPGSGDTYRNFKITIYYTTNYYSVLTNNILEVSDYQIFMSYKAHAASPGVAGLNIASITSSPFYNPNLDKIPPNKLFLMRNGYDDINYITVISTQGPADVRVLISDLIG